MILSEIKRKRGKKKKRSMYRLQVHPRLVGASVGGKQSMCLSHMDVSLSPALPSFHSL